MLNKSILALRSGREGRLYAGTYGDGVYRSVNTVMSIKETEQHRPLTTRFSLAQNYPNPFNPETNIGFHLPEARHVVLRIYNFLGEEIRVVAESEFESGVHSIRWDGKDMSGNHVSTGVYFYQLHAGEFVETKKLILMR